MNNKSRIHFYAAFFALLLSVLLPPAVLTLKTTICHFLVFVCSVVRTARLSTSTLNRVGSSGFLASLRAVRVAQKMGSRASARISHAQHCFLEVSEVSCAIFL